MLAAYKVYIDGQLVSIGPGRGEANVLDRNSSFLSAPYATVDVTGSVSNDSVLAIEGMAPLYSTPCDLHVCRNPNTAGGGVLAQLTLTLSEIGAPRLSTVTIATGTPGDLWTVHAADEYYNPTPAGVSVPGLDSETAYAKILEHTDAGREIVGWRIARFVHPEWAPAVVSVYQARDALIARMARPLELYNPPEPMVTGPFPGLNETSPKWFLVDFGREFQGGVVLDVFSTDAAEGTTVTITSGELLLPNGTVRCNRNWFTLIPFLRIYRFIQELFKHKTMHMKKAAPCLVLVMLICDKHSGCLLAIGKLFYRNATCRLEYVYVGFLCIQY